MPITFGYQPVSAIYGLAQQAGAMRNANAQADRNLRRAGMALDAQLTREGRAQQLYGQQQQNQAALQRMMFGAQLENQQLDKRFGMQNQADLQKLERTAELQAQRDVQLQGFQAQQQEEEFDFRRQQAAVEAANERAEYERRIAAESFQKNVMSRLNEAGAIRHSEIQSERSAIERAYAGGQGQGTINEETYMREMQRLDAEQQGLSDPQYLIPHGQKPGDVVEKDGAQYTINKDGIQEFSGLKDEFEYAKTHGGRITYDKTTGEVASIDYVLPSGRPMKVRTPIYDEIMAERKQHASEVADYNKAMAEYRANVQRTFVELLKNKGEDGDSPYSAQEAKLTAETMFDPPSPVQWTPRSFSNKPTDGAPAGTPAPQQTPAAAPQVPPEPIPPQQQAPAQAPPDPMPQAGANPEPFVWRDGQPSRDWTPEEVNMLNNLPTNEDEVPIIGPNDRAAFELLPPGTPVIINGKLATKD